MTNPDPTTPVQPAGADPATPPPATEQRNDPQALAAKNRELLGLNKKLQEQARDAVAKSTELESLKTKLTKIGEAFGFDPMKETPEEKAAKDRAQREADERAAQQKGAKLKDEVMLGLVAMGRKLHTEAVRAIIAGASISPLITVGEDGNVNGVSEYIGAVLGTLAPVANDAQPTAARLPRGDGKQAEEVEAKFANVKTWQALVKMGLEAKDEFAKKYPVRYARLQADFDSRFTPRPT